TASSSGTGVNQQAPPVANPPAQQPPVYTDDRHESPNLPNGYWALSSSCHPHVRA
ncbi:hypothetical protein A2U01_0042747, partial [Trifolium medium]|nr:hypothetical protein [Trifolium medium]